jgi:hypothetical protein
MSINRQNGRPFLGRNVTKGELLGTVVALQLIHRERNLSEQVCGLALAEAELAAHVGCGVWVRAGSCYGFVLPNGRVIAVPEQAL